MRLVLLLLMLPAYAGAQVFPYEVRDSATNRNLYWLWEQISKVEATGSSSYIPLGAVFSGDVTGTYNATVVGDNSHAHSFSTLSGVLQSPATFYVVKNTDYLVAPASFSYLTNPNVFLTAPATFYVVRNTDYLLNPATFTLTVSGGGDNLGDHVATMTLTMGAYGINTSSAVNAGRFELSGSTIMAKYANTLLIGGGGNKATGNNNTLIGIGTAGNLTGGTANVAIGPLAGASLTSGHYNILIGYNAGNALTETSRNILIGANSGRLVASNYNVFVGDLSGYYTAGGQSNVFLGYQSGFSNANGAENTFVGMDSAISNTSGSRNTSIGFQSLYRNQTGSNNTVIGQYAGGGSAGGGNSFSSSTIMGYQAGTNIATGNNNIVIGQNAAAALTTGSHNIVIGGNANVPAVDINSYLSIGGALVGDLATSSITVNGVLSAPEICLAGDCQTEWAAGGDVVAAGTNTLTGANTFTGSVTVSSFTAAGNTSFTGATSTMTVAGWINIGYEYISCSAAASTVNCSCPAGKVLVGGGGCESTTGSQIGGIATSSNTFKCVFTTSGLAYNAIQCARLK